jgi:hypothetical protein
VKTKRNPMPNWVVPALAGSFAAPTFAAFWIGGRPVLGALWAGVNLAFALVLVAGGRRDTIRMLRGIEDDERAVLIAYQAATITAIVWAVALTGLFLAAGIRGESGLAYGILLLVGEAVHLGALAALNRHGPIPSDV